MTRKCNMTASDAQCPRSRNGCVAMSEHSKSDLRLPNAPKASYLFKIVNVLI